MPNNIRTKVGDKYGRLIVVRILQDRSEHNRGLLVDCRCECGNVKNTVPAGKLRSGKIVSCGCVTIENARSLGKASTKHGAYKTRTYNIWCGIKARCGNKNNPSYPDYGGRGISVCRRWCDSYEAFLADMGEAPDGYLIDRNDVNGNYELDNCEWVSIEKSAQNRRNSIFVEVNGEMVTIEKASRITGTPAGTIRYRVKNGRKPF